ncbi:1972_t:CDS:2 [Entrophospora sp. SA101]|nr:1972_t:CDS:2 [Entrophospora sp. SA101]
MTQIIRKEATKPDIKIPSFSESASKFASVEEESLRIKVYKKDSMRDILEADIDHNIIPELRDYILAEIKDSEYNVRKGFEKDVDEFVLFLCDQENFDDGVDLNLGPCTLELELNKKEIAAYADIKGRRGAEIVWVLFSGMLIAAAQWNYFMLDKVYPAKIVGIRVIGGKFCFYSPNINQSYLEGLLRGLSRNDLHVHKYPKGYGFCISNANERREVLACLSDLKHYALSLSPRLDKYSEKNLMWLALFDGL